jgi:hypothetical protein
MRKMVPHYHCGAVGGINLPAVSQPCRNAVDGEMDSPLNQFVIVPGAMALEQGDLQMVERINVGCPGQQATRKCGVVL